MTFSPESLASWTRFGPVKLLAVSIQRTSSTPRHTLPTRSRRLSALLPSLDPAQEGLLLYALFQCLESDRSFRLCLRR